jgi:hypothetical protein
MLERLPATPLPGQSTLDARHDGPATLRFLRLLAPHAHTWLVHRLITNTPAAPVVLMGSTWCWEGQKMSKKQPPFTTYVIGRSHHSVEETQKKGEKGVRKRQETPRFRRFRMSVIDVIREIPGATETQIWLELCRRGAIEKRPESEWSHPHPFYNRLRGTLAELQTDNLIETRLVQHSQTLQYYVPADP